VRHKAVNLLVLAVVLVSAGCGGKFDRSRSFAVQHHPVPKPDGRAPAPGGGETGYSPRGTVVAVETSVGTFLVDLWEDAAPQTVGNFLQYVDEGFYDGLIFHRVERKFIIQGGGYTPKMQRKPTRKPIRNEASSDKPNRRGTMAMARAADPHSAASQFFINLQDNSGLNHRGKTPLKYGYCAFGKVIEGMDVVDRIGNAPTAKSTSFPADPVQIIHIRRMR